MHSLFQQISRITPARIEGSVVQCAGLTAAVKGFPVPVGAQVEIQNDPGAAIPAEVIGFRDDLTLLYPLKSLAGVRKGNRVRLRRTEAWLHAGSQLLGRVLDAQGRALDGRPLPFLPDRVPRDRPAPPAVERPLINRPLATGIRAIDGLLTCGQGQRIGIFAGAGIGKSQLLGMVARNTAADVIVLAVIGERGREANEFVQHNLKAEGMRRSVVVVSTSDEPAPARLNAAFTATAIAEYFRDRGKNVLLLVDSVTRLAMAQREIGLAAGEPPATRGYPPSVFSMLPRLIERAGRTDQGSITAFYSVLVEGDDPHEPIADALRGLLDGHICLSRKLANAGHYPAIDVLDSLSRLMPHLVSDQHASAARHLRQLLSAYRDHEDMISLGAYRSGSHGAVDEALEKREAISRYLCQNVSESCDGAAAESELIELASSNLGAAIDSR